MESDIFQLMNRGNAITKRIVDCGSAITAKNIVNNKLASLDMLQKTYRETIVTKILEDLKNGNILVLYMPIDKRLPANMPFLKASYQG